MQSSSDYELVSITEFIPSNDPVKKHRVLDTLSKLGLLVPCILLAYCPSSNIGNLHFMWKVPRNADPIQCLQNSQPIIEKAKTLIPSYHTRFMRSSMYQKFGRISSCIKPAVLFYKSLTGL